MNNRDLNIYFTLGTMRPIKKYNAVSVVHSGNKHNAINKIHAKILLRYGMIKKVRTKDKISYRITIKGRRFIY